MVHALSEIRRVLAPEGVLIDMRPLMEQWPVEASWSSGYAEAGHATDLPTALADDVAANSAIAEAVRAGRLQREGEEVFPFFYYWDTPKEMQDYLAENWDDVIRVEEAAWANLRSVWATATADARVRIRLKMLIARYQLQK